MYVCIYVTCSNEMNHMSANLISRKHRINIALRYLMILTFRHQSTVQCLFYQLSMHICHLYYYLVLPPF